VEKVAVGAVVDEAVLVLWGRSSGLVLETRQGASAVASSGSQRPTTLLWVSGRAIGHP